MNATVRSPLAKFSPGNGLLRNDCFQMAYATSDLDRACGVFADRFGIKKFRRLEGQLPAGGHIRIELAWVGGTMYELLRAEGPGSDFFMSVLPSDGFAIRHHHLGFFIDTLSDWTALEAEIERGGWPIRSKSNNQGFLRACIVEVPELGHYLEYIFPEPAGIAFFESVPGN
jgi:hypothetical protein